MSLTVAQNRVLLEELSSAIVSASGNKFGGAHFVVNVL